MAEYFKAFVFIPNLKTVLATYPDRFRCFKNLIGIVDCTEVFIKTPKSLELQRATWSEYKHHNKVKFLACVAPSSSVIQGGLQKCPYFSLAITFTKIRKPSRFFLHSYWKFIEFFWWKPL